MHSKYSVRDDYKSRNLGSRNGAVRDISYSDAVAQHAKITMKCNAESQIFSRCAPNRWWAHSGSWACGPEPYLLKNTPNPCTLWEPDPTDAYIHDKYSCMHKLAFIHKITTSVCNDAAPTSTGSPCTQRKSIRTPLLAMLPSMWPCGFPIHECSQHSQTCHSMGEDPSPTILQAKI